MNLEKKRLREQATVTRMVAIYCRAHHGSSLCPDCQALADYARRRSQECPKLAEKTFCLYCSSPCYGPKEREQIRRVMKYSGPRLLWHQPILSLKHLLVGLF